MKRAAAGPFLLPDTEYSHSINGMNLDIYIRGKLSWLNSFIADSRINAFTTVEKEGL